MSATINEYLRRNVLGLVAIFLALGGVSYAAGLQPNSVRSKHIVNGQVKKADLGAGAVNSAKIADNSLTGADIKSAAVGAADLATRQSQRVASNPRTTSTPCPAQSGIFCGYDYGSGFNHGFWSNFDTSTAEGATFFKDISGVVHLQGLVRCDTTTEAGYPCDSAIFFLPPGYRPAGHLVIATDSTGTKHAKIDIYDDGAVRWFSPYGDSSGYLTLSGISFRASQ